MVHMMIFACGHFLLWVMLILLMFSESKKLCSSMNIYHFILTNLQWVWQTQTITAFFKCCIHAKVVSVRYKRLKGKILKICISCKIWNDIKQSLRQSLRYSTSEACFTLISRSLCPKNFFFHFSFFLFFETCADRMRIDRVTHFVDIALLFNIFKNLYFPILKICIRALWQVLLCPVKLLKITIDFN